MCSERARRHSFPVLRAHVEWMLTAAPNGAPKGAVIAATIAAAVGLFVLLACLPAGPGSGAPAPPALSPTPTATSLPPTPTATPTPLPGVGTVVQDMTQKHETLAVEQIDDLLRGFLPASNRPPAKYAVDTYRIWFRTRDETDQVISIQADVRFPRVDAPARFPVFVYGSGTTGIANKCATLNEYFAGRKWGNYRSHMTSYAAQGYIAVLPNWEGFDDHDQTHPYFIGELEGRVMLDAARAAYDFFEHPPAGDILARPEEMVFLGGYSQGGHGAFAAASMAADYAPELAIKGVVGHAAAPDVEGLIHDSPLYGPYVIYAYRDFYGQEIIDPADVFLPYWLSTFESDVTTKCIDDALSYYANVPTRIYTPKFCDALYNNRLGELFPAFKEKLDANNSSGRAYPPVPVIILHGAADPIVQVNTIKKFINYMCAADGNVTYRLYPGVDHFQTRQYSFVDTLTWMQNIVDGNIPPSNCGQR